MLRFKLIAILATLTIVSGPDVVAQSKKGGLSFESTLWDFGTVNEGNGPVMHTFSFRNHGTSTIRLERVSVSCSCVKVYTGETSFAPGESGELSVSFNPEGLSGDQEKTVTVYTGDSRIILDIRGKIVNQRVDDGYSINLGNGLRARTMDLNYGVIYPGDKFLRALMLWNDSDKGVEVSAVGQSQAVKVLGGGVIPAGEKAEIDVVYELPSSSVTYGTLTERFWLNVNGTPVSRSVNISARCIEKTPRSASVKPRMEISAKELEIRRFFWQSRASGSLELTNSGNGALKVLKVETEGVGECSLSGGVTVPAGKAVKISVTLTGTSGMVRLFTNDPVRPYLEIPCKVR